VSKETYYSVKRDLVQCQKRPVPHVFQDEFHIHFCVFNQDLELPLHLPLSSFFTARGLINVCMYVYVYIYTHIYITLLHYTHANTHANTHNTHAHTHTQAHTQAQTHHHTHTFFIAAISCCPFRVHAFGETMSSSVMAFSAVISSASLWIASCFRQHI